MPLVPYIELNNGIEYTSAAAGEVRLSSILDFPTGAGKAILSIRFPTGANRAKLTLRAFGTTNAPIEIPSDLAVTSQVGTFANVTSDLVLAHEDAVDLIIGWVTVHE